MVEISGNFFRLTALSSMRYINLHFTYLLTYLPLVVNVTQSFFLAARLIEQC